MDWISYKKRESLMRSLNRLFLWQKFALLAVLGGLLVAVPLTLYLQEAGKSLESARLEANGIAPTRAVLHVVTLMQQHRGLSAMMLAGSESAPAQRAAKQIEVEKAIAAADAFAVDLADAALVSRWQKAKERWPGLAAGVESRALSGKDSFAGHTALIGDLLKLNGLLLDHFRLSLDPSLDSTNLIAIALVESPVLMEMLGRMRAKGSGALTAQQISLEDRALMVAMLDNANTRYAAAQDALDKVAAANPALRGVLSGALEDAQAVGKEVTRVTQSEIIMAEQFSFAASDYFALTTSAIAAQLKLYDGAIAALDDLLQQRRAQTEQTLYLLAGGILLLATAVAAFGILIARSITRPVAEAVAVARRVAAGDLAGSIVVESGNETGQLLQALKDMNDGLVRIVTSVRGGTHAIANASSEIASGNLDLSSRTEEQASSLEETASSMEEITGTVLQNADNARQASELAATAAEIAGKGGEMVSQVVETMDAINDSSRRIADIVGVIDSIAFQTNILALNAAVEAARAGEQGRGFAVVAAEVRALAQRSAAAAGEIKGLINDSVTRVDAGARLVDQTGATMQEIVASVQRVNSLIREIAAASDEQATGITQVNQAINQMDQVTQQNASLVEEAAAAAEALQEQAQHLKGTVEVFRLGDRESAVIVPLRAAHPAEMPAAQRVLRLTDREAMRKAG